MQPLHYMNPHMHSRTWVSFARATGHHGEVFCNLVRTLFFVMGRLALKFKRYINMYRSFLTRSFLEGHWWRQLKIAPNLILSASASATGPPVSAVSPASLTNASARGPLSDIIVEPLLSLSNFEAKRCQTGVSKNSRYVERNFSLLNTLNVVACIKCTSKIIYWIV